MAEIGPFLPPLRTGSRPAESEASEELSRQAGAIGHRPYGGNREAARRTGLSEQEVRRTRRLDVATEAFTVFQRAEWMWEWAVASHVGNRLGAVQEFGQGRCAIFEETRAD